MDLNLSHTIIGDSMEKRKNEEKVISIKNAVIKKTTKNIAPKMTLKFIRAIPSRAPIAPRKKRTQYAPIVCLSLSLHSDLYSLLKNSRDKGILVFDIASPPLLFLIVAQKRRRVKPQNARRAY